MLQRFFNERRTKIMNALNKMGYLNYLLPTSAGSLGFKQIKSYQFCKKINECLKNLKYILNHTYFYATVQKELIFFVPRSMAFFVILDQNQKGTILRDKFVV